MILQADSHDVSLVKNIIAAHPQENEAQFERRGRDSSEDEQQRPYSNTEGK